MYIFIRVKAETVQFVLVGEYVVFLMYVGGHQNVLEVSLI